MKTIELTHGHSVIVDDVFFEELSRAKWHCSKGYAARVVYTNQGKAIVWMHRFILERKIGRKLLHNEFPDHIDRNPFNNKSENLRVVTKSQNAMNSRLRSDSKSGYRGVSWSKQKKKWRSTININKVQKHLGFFDSIKDADTAYKNAAKDLFGEFMRFV